MIGGLTTEGKTNNEVDYRAALVLL